VSDSWQVGDNEVKEREREREKELITLLFGYYKFFIFEQRKRLNAYASELVNEKTSE